MPPVNRVSTGIPFNPTLISPSGSYLKKIAAGVLGFALATAEANDNAPIQATPVGDNSRLTIIAALAVGVLGILAWRRISGPRQPIVVGDMRIVTSPHPRVEAPSPDPKVLFKPDPLFKEYKIADMGEVTTTLNSLSPDVLMSFLAFASSNIKLSSYSFQNSDRLNGKCTLKEILFIGADWFRRLARKNFLALKEMMEAACYDKKMIDAFCSATLMASQQEGCPAKLYLASMTPFKGQWVELMSNNPIFLHILVKVMLNKISRNAKDEPSKFSLLKDFLRSKGINYEAYKVQWHKVLKKDRLDPNKLFYDKGQVQLPEIRCDNLGIYSEEDLMGLIALASQNQEVMCLFEKRGGTTSHDQLEIATFGNKNIIEAFIDASKKASKEESRTQFFLQSMTPFKDSWTKLFIETHGNFLAELLTVLMTKAGWLDISSQWLLNEKIEKGLITQRYQRFLDRFGIKLSPANKGDGRQSSLVVSGLESKDSSLQTSSALIRFSDDLICSA